MDLVPEVKEAWVAALRSGEYKQGKGALRAGAIDGDGDAYCCLGVLCEVAVKAGVIEKSVPDGWVFIDNHRVKAYSYDNDSGTLPPDSVIRWAFGQEKVNGTTMCTLDNKMWGGARVWLPSMNDSRGMTFAEIADVIEKVG